MLMARHRQPFLFCPACGKKGVTMRLRAEDYWGCRYCDWYCFTGGTDRQDVEGREQLRAANLDVAPRQERGRT